MAIKPIPNEQKLLTQIKLGDERAFALLFEGYGRKIAEFVFKITASQEITEEIVQDIFVKIWVRRHQLAEVNSFTNYLFILSRNQTISYLRKKAVDDLKYQEWEKEQVETAEGEEHFTAAYRQRIEKAIETLPAQQKKVFILSKYERLKYDEIAVKLSISSETVKKHLQGATKSIKIFVNDPKNRIILSILLSRIRF